jgi:hypothetical protein
MKECKKCGSKLLHHGYWSRAYNSLCQQAAGDKGVRCYDCGDIVWEEPNFDKWISEMPEWIVPYKNK